MDRDDQQAKGSLVIPRADGSTAFIDYTDNAAASEHRGLEWELQWQPTRQVAAALTLGLLDAQFDRYITATGADLRDATSRKRRIGSTPQGFLAGIGASLAATRSRG